MFDHNPPPNRVRRSWRHKRLAASISAEIEAQVGGAALDLSVALNASLPDPTDSTTTESETTTTSESQTPTETTTTTTTTTTSTETTTTTTTSTSFSTITSTSLSTSISTSISTSSRTRTFTHDQTSSLTQTSTLSATRFTTSTTFTTSTSLTTSTSQTLYTHTTLFTSSPSSSLFTADTSSSSISINIPATTGVLGSGENNDKGFAHSTGAIVGVSAGILVFVLLVGILLFFGVKRYRRKYKSSSGSPSPVRPPIDGEEEPELHPSPIDQSSPVDQDQARFSPLVATTSLGHGSSSGEDGDVPHVIAPGSVDIHGASTESGGTLYPHSSQGHSTSSGDHLLGGGSPTSPSGYAPFALSPSSPRPPSAWRDPPTSPTASSSGHGHSSLLPTVPMPVPTTQRPASSKSGKRRSLLDRVFGNTSKRSPSPSSVASDTPRASMSSPMTELPFGDSAPWRRPPPSFLGPDPITAEPGTLSLLPPSLRERNLSAPEGLLHPKRPDLFTQESSRTLMDHVDYSRPILPESHAHKTSITDTTASDTKSTKVMTPDTEGLNPMDAVP